MIHVVSNDIKQWYTKVVYICSLTNLVDPDEMPFNHTVYIDKGLIFSLIWVCTV